MPCRARTCRARLPALRALLKAAEILYVGTCNRVEVVYCHRRRYRRAGDSRHEVFRILTGREPHPGEAARMLRAWTGEAAVEHLFLLACGLDSAQTGEQEIAAQLRGAWEDSRAAHTCGPVLDRLIGEALGMARRVRRLSARRAAALARGSGRAARAAASRRHGGARGAHRRLAHDAPLRGAPARAHVPLLIVNRTLRPPRNSRRTSAREALPLEDFRAQPPALSALVLAAGGGEALLDAGGARAAEGAAPDAPLLIDFGVPPNVDPAAARRAGLARIGMDDLIESAQGRRLAQLCASRRCAPRSMSAWRTCAPSSRCAPSGRGWRTCAAPSSRSPPRKWRVRSRTGCVHSTRGNGRNSSGSPARWRIGSRTCRSPGLRAAAVHAGTERWMRSSRPRKAMRRSRTDAEKT